MPDPSPLADPAPWRTWPPWRTWTTVSSAARGPTSTPVYVAYHDTEWGFPVTDDHRLFEKLCLEGFQSGLSWLTILNKRERFREVFPGFDYEQVARFDDTDVERLLTDAGIVRHRGKIEATINNARRACELVDEFGSLAAYVWRYEPDRPAEPAVLDEVALGPCRRRRSRWRCRRT